MRFILLALLLAGCASAPEVKTDNVKDGTVVCATAEYMMFRGTTVIAKLEQKVITDGGSVTISPQCAVEIQLAAPLPKQAPPIKPAVQPAK